MVKDIDLINYNFKDYRGEDKEDVIKQFIVDFCEYDGILDKRINKLFSMNPFLYQYYEKDDVKQEVMLALLSKAIKKFPYIIGESRLRYFNTVVSSVICNLMKAKFDSVPTLILDYNMNIEDTDSGDINTLNQIFDLFVNEQLERQLLELYYKGFSERQIMKIMGIGQKKFETIRDNIRTTIKEKL